MFESRLSPCSVSALVVACVAALTPSAHSAVIFSGDPNVTGGTATLQITRDIDFTVTTSGLANFLVFDNWVGTSDGSLNFINANAPANLSYRIDGGSTQSAVIYRTFDNHRNSGAVGLTDGFLFFDGLSLVAGQTVTILAQTHTFAGNNFFNPATKQVFTGDVFLTTVPGAQLSSTVSLSSVPEPSEWAVAAGVGLLGFAVWRRRVRTAAVV